MVLQYITKGAGMAPILLIRTGGLSPPVSQ